MSSKFVRLSKVPNHNEWFRQHYHQFPTAAAVEIRDFNQKPLSIFTALSFFLHPGFA